MRFKSQILFGVALPLLVFAKVNSAVGATRESVLQSRLTRTAALIWPEVPKTNVRAWARAQPDLPIEFLHDPERRVTDLIRAELAARATGAAPDADRLDQTLDTLFAVARRSLDHHRTPFSRKMDRQLHALNFLLVGAATAAGGACAQMLGHTAVTTGMLYGGLTVTAATLTYIAINLPFDGVPGLPTQGLFREPSEQSRALERFSSVIADRLRFSPEWRQSFPGASPDQLCADHAALLRAVWSPGDLRRAAVRRFGRAK